jgi:hypothetical protein
MRQWEVQDHSPNPVRKCFEEVPGLPGVCTSCPRLTVTPVARLADCRSAARYRFEMSLGCRHYAISPSPRSFRFTDQPRVIAPRSNPRERSHSYGITAALKSRADLTRLERSPQSWVSPCSSVAEIIFVACSACRVRASTPQASFQLRQVCLPPSGVGSRQDL